MKSESQGFTLVELMISLAIMLLIGRGIVNLTLNLGEQKSRILARDSAEELSQSIFATFERDMRLINKNDRVCPQTGWCSDIIIPFHEHKTFSQFEVKCQAFAASHQLGKINISEASKTNCTRQLNCPDGTLPVVTYYRGGSGKRQAKRFFPAGLDRLNPKGIRSQALAASICAKADLNGLVWLNVDVLYLDQNNEPRFLTKSQSFSSISFGGIQHVE